MRRRGRALVALAVAVASLALAACGRDDFENNPRPPTAVEISIKVADDGLTVSPREFGAGIANFTILNLGDEPTAIGIAGPTAGESADIPPGTSGVLKLDLKTGEYEATARDLDLEEVEPFDFVVGPDRESSNNELLLP
jgi:hypothetical protein